MKRLVSFVALFFVVAIGLSFAALNSNPVQLRYHFGEFVAPLSMVVVLSVAAGAVLGVVASLSLLLSQRIELASLRKRLDLCEREVRNLRELPFKEQ